MVSLLQINTNKTCCAFLTETTNIKYEEKYLALYKMKSEMY